MKKTNNFSFTVEVYEKNACHSKHDVNTLSLINNLFIKNHPVVSGEAKASLPVGDSIYDRASVQAKDGLCGPEFSRFNSPGSMAQRIIIA